jgi:hypothetical protein
MSQDNRLWLCEQKGNVEIDLKQTNEILVKEYEELIRDKSIDKMIEVNVYGQFCFIINEDGDSWESPCIPVYGYSELPILETISKNILNDVKLLFALAREGWPPITYKVSKNLVEKITA